MKETIRSNYSRYLTAGLALSAVLTASACAEGARVNADRATLRQCDGEGLPAKGANNNASLLLAQGTKKPIASGSEVVSAAQADVLELQKVALANNGTLNFSDHKNVEIHATSDKLTMALPATSEAASWPGEFVTDNLTFNITDGTVKVVAAALTCSANGQIYANNGFTSLEHFAQEAKALAE